MKKTRALVWKMVTQVKWKRLIRSFERDGQEYKVVREAEGIAPWGSPIKAELHESEIDYSILASLPEQGGRSLAILNAKHWEIWVTPSNEIHIVHPHPVTKHPDEYLLLTRAPSIEDFLSRRF